MINMPHQIMINAPAEKVYEAITTTEGFKGWWTTDAC
ncbi:SRPBCC domain-containing protein [Peribacillus butanolivorans]|nr:SRPBCC domain-containing protein [Peribacillus butanolivorans]